MATIEGRVKVVKESQRALYQLLVPFMHLLRWSNGNRLCEDQGITDEYVEKIASAMLRQFQQMVECEEYDPTGEELGTR